MTEITEYSPGSLCWADLSTAAQRASKSFYQSLFDWDAFDAPIGEGMVYSQMLLRGRPVAAIGPSAPGRGDAAASWDVYVNVADADQAVARATSLGATVTGDGPYDVFEFGRMAELTDPQGARFRLWQPRQHIGAEIVREPGSIAWYELATPDPEAASDFYSELFGWTVSPVPGIDDYLSAYTAAGDGTAGITTSESGLSGWITYLWTDDVDATLAQALAGGAEQILPATDIPNAMGRFTIVRDPQGATVGFFRG